MAEFVVYSCAFRRTSMVTALTVVAVVWAGFYCHLVAAFACPPSVCTCRWKGGKETAECVGKRLDKIPAGLSRGTQVLDVSRNNLNELPKEAFFNEGLLNLQKVHVAECKIRKIHDNAFSHLANLVELDLGSNLLIAVPSETFVDYPGLRRLNLNNNPIRRIESNAFVKLPSLAHLELSECILEYVAPRAFVGLHHLQHLKLSANKLTTLPPDVGFPIDSLLSIDLFDNPWLCDCHLRVLRNWLADDDLPVNAPPKCSEPQRVAGRSLLQVVPEEYACQPQVAPSQSQTTTAEAFVGESASLVCSVHADPPADVRWTRHGRALLNVTKAVGGPASGGSGSRGGAAQHYVVHERGSVDRTSVLTMSMVAGEEDAGEYLCVAENVAGQVVVNVTLEVSTRQIEASSLSNGHIAGLSVGLIVVSAATIVFICILLAKMRQQRSDETKHLHDLDAKKHHHHQQQQHHATANHVVVNHVKFDVTKEKLELNSSSTNGGENNSLRKPLCSAPQTTANNYSSHATPSDSFHLEDSIGGCFRSASNSSFGATRLISSKPDVVNFTCSRLTSPEAANSSTPFSPAGNDNRTVSDSGTLRRGSSSQQQQNSIVHRSSPQGGSPPPQPQPNQPSTRDGESDYRATDSASPMYYSSCKDGLIKSSSFRSPSNDDDDQRLCDYVQLYEDSCLAANTTSGAIVARRPTPPGGSGLIPVSSPQQQQQQQQQHRDSRTDFSCGGDMVDRDWPQRRQGDGIECADSESESVVVQRAPDGFRRWYGSVEDNEKMALVTATDDSVGGDGEGHLRDEKLNTPVSNVVNNNNRQGRLPPPVPAKPRHRPLGNGGAGGVGILKHANLHGRNYVPVLPPLPVHHFAQARDSPDEGYEDEVEEEIDM